ncbi:MAG TPA: hypothetical protein VHC18_01860 [Amycolatopsis sp.]|nr:hypothetical protein [Amycolatopsis sp.]
MPVPSSVTSMTRSSATETVTVTDWARVPHGVADRLPHDGIRVFGQVG